MERPLDIILLLALPASGKSEVRRYLAGVPADTLMKDFHIGETLQLDDFPYVHMMRRTDDELSRLGRKRVFFQSGDKPFMDPKDWGTLIHLINEDYRDLIARKTTRADSAAELLFARIDKAGERAGIPSRLSALDEEARRNAVSCSVWTRFTW